MSSKKVSLIKKSRNFFSSSFFFAFLFLYVCVCLGYHLCSFFQKIKKTKKRPEREDKKTFSRKKEKDITKKNSSSHHIIIMLGARQSDVFFGERESGRDVRQNNATAVQAVANIVKSSLGPVGLDKVRLCSRSAILIFDFSIFFFSSSSSSLL